MTWDAHQARGAFGFQPPEKDEKGWQRRWLEVVDIDEALHQSAPLREVFWKWMQWPDAQPFTGGIWDAWPARTADALAFARQEWRLVQAYVKSLEVK